MSSPARRFFALLGAIWIGLATARAETDWVEASNTEAQRFIDVLGEFQPEGLSGFGIPGYDDRISDMTPGYRERYRHALTILRETYRQRLDQVEDPFVREDINILIDSIDESVDSSLINEQYLLPWRDASRQIYAGIFSLLKPDTPAEKRGYAIARLKRYLGLDGATAPFLALFRADYEAAQVDPSRLPPFADNVTQAIANTPRFLAGIRELLGADDFDPVEVRQLLATLETQLTTHTIWIRENVLPSARTDFRVPAPVYADNLRGFGLDISPEQLISRAQTAYAEIRNEMRSLAILVAQERGWTETDYPTVIRKLKREQLPADEIIPFYQDIISQIEEIIRRERIVTLPDRPMAIRLASEAENAAQPAPHMSPPPLMGGTGEERGTFVLTSGTPPVDGETAATFDDFTFAAGTWTLTAHEGRPGHELQFAAMVERGVSITRSYFAFNSVNVEGWALYAEAELKPYEPLAGQLIALQHRLLRASRAFLDPMLNLGLLTPDQARRILSEDVVLSDAMVKQEVDRYTFRMPGQATAYFYGYIQLMAIRADTEIVLGDKFNRQAFNDFIIAQGLLPAKLLAAAVRNDFISSQTND